MAVITAAEPSDEDLKSFLSSSYGLKIANLKPASTVYLKAQKFTKTSRAKQSERNEGENPTNFFLQKNLSIIKIALAEERKGQDADLKKIESYLIKMPPEVYLSILKALLKIQFFQMYQYFPFYEPKILIVVPTDISHEFAPLTTLSLLKTSALDAHLSFAKDKPWLVTFNIVTAKRLGEGSTRLVRLVLYGFRMWASGKRAQLRILSYKHASEMGARIQKLV